MESEQEENSWQSVIKRLGASDNLEPFTGVFAISLQLFLHSFWFILFCRITPPATWNVASAPGCAFGFCNVFSLTRKKELLSPKTGKVNCLLKKLSILYTPLFCIGLFVSESNEMVVKCLCTAHCFCDFSVTTCTGPS